MKNKTLIIAVLLILAAISLILVLNSQNIKPPLAVGSNAPKLEVTDVRTSTALNPSDVSGKVVFINFWASWCKPCREEMPSIEALYQELKDNDRFIMLTVLYNDTPEQALEFVKSYQYTVPVFSDASAGTAKLYGVTGVPETYLVDKKGVLRKRVIGPYHWDSSEAKGFIYSLINE